MSIGTLYLSVEVIGNCDCRTLSVLDTSFYPQTPESPTLDITMPGYQSRRFQFETGKVNIFNSYSLLLNSVNTVDCLIDLPDGLWTFQYSICPNETLYKIFYHLRTCKLEARFMKIDAATIDVCASDSKKLIQLRTIEDLIRGGQANAFIGNCTQATKLYQKADELLSRLENSSSPCGC